MTQKLMRPLTSKGSDLGANVFPTRCIEDNTDIARFGQSEYQIDVVALLARRSRVHPSTIAAQLAAWQIGGAR